jgi:hypothetical protein
MLSLGSEQIDCVLAQPGFVPGTAIAVKTAVDRYDFKANG